MQNLIEGLCIWFAVFYFLGIRNEHWLSGVRF
jgi:hypothetical protein